MSFAEYSRSKQTRIMRQVWHPLQRKVERFRKNCKSDYQITHSNKPKMILFWSILSKQAKRWLIISQAHHFPKREKIVIFWKLEKTELLAYAVWIVCNWIIKCVKAPLLFQFRVTRQWDHRTCSSQRNYTSFFRIGKEDTIVCLASNMYSHVTNDCEYSIFHDIVFHSWKYYRINIKATTPDVSGWKTSMSFNSNSSSSLPVLDYHNPN